MASLQFLKNNNLDNSYEHTIDFATIEDQNAFWKNELIDTMPAEITTSRLLYNAPLQIDKSYVDLLNINYMRVYQDGRYWYFFIVDKNFINNNNTSITLELDVMQTFMFDYKLKESYVKQQHEDRLSVNNGVVTPIYSTTKEDYYFGDKYKEILDTKIKQPQTNLAPYSSDYLYFAVVTCSKSFLSFTGEGIMAGGLTTFVVPFIHVSIGDPVIELGSTGYYGETGIAPTLKELSQMAEDEQVKSINIVPVFDSGVLSGATLVEDGVETTICTYRTPYPTRTVTLGNIGEFTVIVPTKSKYELSVLIDKESYIDDIPNINNIKDIKFETKLKTNPYYFYQLYRINEDPFDILNEYLEDGPTFNLNFWSTADGIIRENAYVPRYKLTTSNTYSPDNMKIVVNNAELSLSSNAWLNYFNNNKSTIQTGALVKGITATTSIATGLLTGGFGIATGLQSAIGTASSILQDQMRYSDIKRAPDTVRNVGNGANWELQTGYMRYFLFRKEITDEYKNKLFNDFYRFGYNAQKFILPNTKSRYYFNYIKTIGVSLETNIDNIYSSKIAEIYDKGITFWHYRNSGTWKGTLNYDYENAEMNAIGG